MVQSHGAICSDGASAEKLALLIRKGRAADAAGGAGRVVLREPNTWIARINGILRIAVWARNFRASRSVSIGKGLYHHYGGASSGGAHHVRE